MSYTYIEKIRDGAITLLTRGDSPIIYARFRIKGFKDYRYRTTKTKSLAEAKYVAEELYDEIRYRIKNNLTIDNLPFSRLYDEWYKVQSPYLSIHRKKYIEGTANRYLIPFFNNVKSDELNDNKIEEYWSWRLSYWISGAGVEDVAKAQASRISKNKRYKNKKGNVAKIPAQKTLKMEQGLLKNILYWCNRFGYIRYIPLIKAPQVQPKHVTNRRPCFTEDEWDEFTKYLRIWANDEDVVNSDNTEKAEQKNNSRVTKLHVYQRKMIHNYILIMCGTGLRPNEARQMRWKDIEEFKSDGKKHTMIHVRPSTKTGKREMVAMPRVKGYLARVKQISSHTKDDDLVFCDQKGNAVSNFGKTFKKVLIDCGLLKDKDDQIRTIYSLRHTYATFRLLKSELSYEKLASNMGTSVSMIEKHYSHVSNRQRANELTAIL